MQRTGRRIDMRAYDGFFVAPAERVFVGIFADLSQACRSLRHVTDAQASAYWPEPITLSRLRRLGGMAIAIFHSMPVAKILIAEINAFLSRNPTHKVSVTALLIAVNRIDTEFTGETRLSLLREARTAFLQQIKTLEATEQTLHALETLHSNQRNLVDRLKKIVVTKPEGTTLH
jgi:hypothetical protein